MNENQYTHTCKICQKFVTDLNNGRLFYIFQNWATYKQNRIRQSTFYGIHLFSNYLCSLPWALKKWKGEMSWEKGLRKIGKKKYMCMRGLKGVGLLSISSIKFKIDKGSLQKMKKRILTNCQKTCTQKSENITEGQRRLPY